MFFNKRNVMSSPLERTARVGISSVDFRDGQQSLLATRIKTEDMIPILEKMDSIGFECMEMWGGATFDVCIRFLQEDPWERIREFKKRVKKTPLRMLLRGQNLLGYRQYPDDIVEKFVGAAAAAGIDIFLIFDSLNDTRNCVTSIKSAIAAGKKAEANILYTTSPVHNIKKYIEIARAYEKLGVSAIHLEDMAGLMTPTAAYEHIKALKAEVKVPVHFHAHSTGGMANMAYWEAVRAGVDVIDTDISALSMGTSHPAAESIVTALKDTGGDTGVELNSLEEINNYFLELRKKYSEFESKFTGVNINVLKHQIPGGMLSNMESQLKGMNAIGRMDEILEEVHRVRQDMGYPPLGTPMSQIVGSQATFNVISGQRYKMLTKETKDYIKGMYGQPPGEIDKDLEREALKGAEKINCRPAELLEPEWDKLKAECAAFTRNEEDVLTYALFPTVAREYFNNRH